MPGLTDQGFVARTQPELAALIEQRLSEDDVVGSYNFRAGPIQQLIGVLSELVAEIWEACEETYASQYDGAGGISLDRVSALTGTTRRAATRSTVTGNVTLDPGALLPAGSIASVDGVPDAQFRTTVAQENTTASLASFPVLMESVATGPVAAPSGTLTVIVGAVSGWVGVTNGADADLGRVVADDPELRSTRRRELTGAGAANVDAITAALSRITGVISVRTYQNTTSATVGSRPPKSVEAVVWDGVATAADDDELAQGVWDEVAAGIEPYGTSSGTAVDAAGAERTVAFSRASQLRTYVDATLVLSTGTLLASVEDEIVAAIVERGAEYAVGETVYASQLSCVLQGLAFVEAVASLTVGSSPSPTGSSLAVAESEIATIATADVTPS